VPGILLGEFDLTNARSLEAESLLNLMCPKAPNLNLEHILEMIRVLHRDRNPLQVSLCDACILFMQIPGRFVAVGARRFDDINP
jgi:hypothetical protein